MFESRTIVSLCFAVVTLLLGAPALAANRTVCLFVQINVDSRFNCPASGTTGSYDNCNAATDTSDAVGMELEIWDKDPTGGDEFIGTFVIGTGGGIQCISFPWEGQAYAGGEPHPDVYFAFTNRAVYLASFDRIVRIVDANGNVYNTVSWRDGTAGNSEAYVAWNVEPGQSPTVPSSGSLIPNPDETTNYGKSVISLRSAYLTLQTFGGTLDTIADRLSTDRPKFQRDARSRAGWSDFAS